MIGQLSIGRRHFLWIAKVSWDLATLDTERSPPSRFLDYD